VAERGDDGLHMASTGHYDIVVLDIMLPERDGWSVLAELRHAAVDSCVAGRILRIRNQAAARLIIEIIAP
jgi:DNA-binding response OmpR family regulator